MTVSQKEGIMDRTIKDYGISRHYFKAKKRIMRQIRQGFGSQTKSTPETHLQGA